MPISNALLNAAKSFPDLARPIVTAAARLTVRLGPESTRHSPHWLIKQLVRNLYVRVPVSAKLPNGMQILVPWCDQVGANLLKGAFEPETVNLLEHLVKPGITVLDIGAHVGIYSLLMSGLVGDQGKVHSFEAEPALAEWLSHSSRLNCLGNIEVNATVLSEIDGEVSFFHASDASVNSLVQPREIYGAEIIRLPSMRLDRYIREKEIERIDLVKIDIEGAELRTLKTIQGLLESEARPMLIIEFAESRTPLRDLADFLTKCGYHLYRIAGNLLPVAPDDLMASTRGSPHPAFNALAITPGQPLP